MRRSSKMDGQGEANHLQNRDRWRSNLHRQLAEVEALQSIYAEEGEFRLNPEEKATLEILTQLEEDIEISKAQNISFTVHLNSIVLGGRHASVGFLMPRDYPEGHAVRVLVECGGQITRQEHETINKVAREVAENLVGDEACLLVLQRVQDVALEIEEGQRAQSTQQSNSENLLSVPKTLKRTLIWFHHIKSFQKRKAIVEWGRELQLGGFCKPGFPGIIVFEGEGDDVDEFVKRLQKLRWQAMSVRGEEQEQLSCGQNIDTLRRFALGIKELDENAMSELAAWCREADLENLFLTGLKIYR